MLKKFVIIVMVMSMLSVGSQSLAASNDEPSGWAKAVIAEAIEKGLVPERLQSDYQKPITRGEFSELLVQTTFASYKVLGIRSNKVNPFYWTKESFLEKVTIESKFEDVTEDYIKIAFALGAINGVTDTQFSPDTYVTRQEAATMLANTFHLQLGIAYERDPSNLGYADYSKIADWAKPAVQIVTKSNAMKGIGGNFDYKGHFTREQSIATLLRLYNSQWISFLSLRGNIMIPTGPYDEYTYIVGKDYVKVDFAEADTEHSYGRTLRAIWRSYDETKGKVYDGKQSSIIYSFNTVTKIRELQAVIDNTLANKPSLVDYGYMTMSTFTNNHALEFFFKDVPGYSNLTNGYTYGFPKKQVEIKVLQ